MEQYHQQLQQAQSYYKQNPQILAPPSHSSIARRNVAPRSDKVLQQNSYGPSDRPSFAPSKSSTSHISDSNRSITGAISLPDSGYYYPAHSREPYPTARREQPTTTTSAPYPSVHGPRHAHPSSSSDVRSSLSSDSATHLGVPLAQQQKFPPQATTSESTLSSRIIGYPTKTPQTISTGSNIDSSRTSTSSYQSSVIQTAPGVTPVTSESRISTSSSFVPTSALESTFKANTKTAAQINVPVGKTNNVAAMTTTTDDIVADSEGEEDARDIAPGTLDASIVIAQPNLPEPVQIVGLRKSTTQAGHRDVHQISYIEAGLVTPATAPAPTRDPLSAGTSANPAESPASKSASSAQGSAKTVPPSDAASTSAVTGPPVSTRPKPKRRVRPVENAPSVAEENVASQAASAAGDPTTPIAADSGSSEVSPPPPPKETAEAVVPSKKPPPKTYSSKNKDPLPASKIGVNPASTSMESVHPREGQVSRKAGVSKRKSAVDSESEHSEYGSESGKKPKGKKSSRTALVGSESEHSEYGSGGKQVQKEKKARKPAAKAKVADVDASESVAQVSKRMCKKRAIISSDDETEDEHLQTPDSKRRKPSKDQHQLSRPPPKAVGVPRDSSVDPLDMNAGPNKEGGRLELSVELSPSNGAGDFPLPPAAEGGILKPPVGKTKSPNKVHFVDGSEAEIPDVDPPAMKNSKAKATSTRDEEYDEIPLDRPLADDDDEDDFMPGGSKKVKAKGKTAKGKKATTIKDKAGKGKKATQAKGKKGKPLEEVEPFTEQAVAEVPDQPINLDNLGGAAVEDTAHTESPESAKSPVAPAPKSRAKRIVVVGKKALKSAEVIEEDEPVLREATGEVAETTPGSPAKAIEPVDKDVVVEQEEKEGDDEKYDVKATAGTVLAKAAEVSMFRSVGDVK